MSTDNMILFANGFASYFVCFLVFVAAIVIACFIGIAIRKSKNAKLVDSAASPVDAQASSNGDDNN